VLQTGAEKQRDYTSVNWVRRSSCKKRTEAANNSWSAAYSVQWTRRFEVLNQLVDQVLTWPHIEPSPTSVSPPDTIRIRLADIATDKPSAFLTPREFGRVLLRVPTIYLALPLVCAHWAIVRGWAEPHYLASFGLMPAGAVVVYTPRDEQELGVCHLLFSQSYRFACSFVRREGAS
jgi:hypothetical protein